MTKQDELRRSMMSSITESLGGNRSPGVPVGMNGPAPLSSRFQGLAPGRTIQKVPIEKIVPDSNQPRRTFDPEAIERLGESLRSKGQLQPCTAYWDEGQGGYVLLLGERRWRAAHQAGLSHLNCIILDRRPDESEQRALQIVENALRQDLRPVEQARAFQSLMDLNDWSGNQLAKELSIPQPTIAQALALLKLPSKIQEKVDRGELAATVAYELTKVEDSDQQAALAQRIVEARLTRTDAVAEIRRTQETIGKRNSGRRSGTRGQSKGGPRKLTKRALSHPDFRGFKVTVENRKGIEPAVLASLLECLAEKVRSEMPEAEQGNATPGLDQEHGQAA